MSTGMSCTVAIITRSIVEVRVAVEEGNHAGAVTLVAALPPSVRNETPSLGDAGAS